MAKYLVRITRTPWNVEVESAKARITDGGHLEFTTDGNVDAAFAPDDWRRFYKEGTSDESEGVGERWVKS